MAIKRTTNAKDLQRETEELFRDRERKRYEIVKRNYDFKRKGRRTDNEL